MSVDEFLAEYKRRSLESTVALLREAGDVSLRELRTLLAKVPELRQVTLKELVVGRSGISTRPAPAPLSAAARVAAYLLDLADTGTREGEGILVKAPRPEQLGERVAATPDSVTLALAILERRNLITVHPRRILVRDLRGLALIAERPLARRRSAPT